MILYSTVGTSDMARAIKFHDAAFGALGVGRAPTAGNGSMIAFRAKDEAQVRAFHAAAVPVGGPVGGRESIPRESPHSSNAPRHP
jgi:predicted enzyme related to lactoylglutathione lyase